MTTITHAQRTTSSATSQPENSDGDALPLQQQEAPKAATFEGTTSAAPRRVPFNPPASPKLLDERLAKSPEDLERLRDQNEALIKTYAKEYGAYLERYAQAVDMAPTKDRIRAFGPPARYEPGPSSLPVAQRAYYDAMISKPHLDNATVAYDAIGRAMEKFDGVRPALDTRVQMEASARAFFVGGKVGYDGTAEAGKRGSFELGASYDAKKAQALAPEKETRAVGTRAEDPANVGGSITVDKDGNVVGTVAVEGRGVGAEATFDKDGLKSGGGTIGPVSAKLDRDGNHEIAVKTDAASMSMKNGTLTTEVGAKGDLDVGGYKAEGKAVVGTSYDLKQAQVGVYGKGEIDIMGVFDASVQVGVNVQAVSREHARRMVEGKSLFDEVNAYRSGGR